MKIYTYITAISHKENRLNVDIYKALEGIIMYKILVVDDEEKIRTLISKYATFEGYEVFEASDGMTATEMLRHKDFDLVVLDIMLPDIDGFTVCRELRKTKKTPVIMLSARGEEYDRLHGFEVGVDDYVVKPFSPRELMMRIAAIIKRTSTVAGDFFEYRGLKVDFAGRIVYVDGNKADLTPKEYDLLFYLIKNKGIALTREKLISNVWGYDFFGDDRTLDTHIKLLRKNLGSYSGLIVTLRGVGYRFEAE